jgi:MFS family permease
VFFTQALVLSTFSGVDSGSIGRYIIPLALGDFGGRVVLGHLFDTVGRRVMITISYVGSGLLLLLAAALLSGGAFGAWTLTLAWCAIFFLASAGASAAYLTVSEIFPMETRAMADRLFYSSAPAWAGSSARTCSRSWWRPASRCRPSGSDLLGSGVRTAVRLPIVPGGRTVSTRLPRLAER